MSIQLTADLAGILVTVAANGLPSRQLIFLSGPKKSTDQDKLLDDGYVA